MRQSTRQSSSTDAPSSRQETCSFVPEKLRDSGTAAASSHAPMKPAAARQRPPFVLGSGSAGPGSRSRADATIRSLIAPKVSAPKQPAQATETAAASGATTPRRSSSLPPPSPRATMPPPPPRASAALPTPSVGSTRAAVRGLDATLEVSEDDVSILDGHAPYIPPPPPLPRRPRLAQPKLVWGIVAGAWCIMVCLTLLAVDEPDTKLRPAAAHKLSSEASSASGSAASNATPAQAPGALAPAGEASAVGTSAAANVATPSASSSESSAQKPAPSAPADTAPSSTSAAQTTQPTAEAAAAAERREQAVGAHRDATKKRIKAGLSKRIKRTKRHRATREPIPERS